MTSIGNSAFYGCSNLTSVYITDLEAWCNIKFGENYYANPLNHGANLYLNGSLVKDLVIPDSVTSIGDYAFRGCSSLTSVIIPDSVTSIGNSAFSGCSSLIYNEYDNGLYLGNADNPYLVFVEAKYTSITSCEINNRTKIILNTALSGCSSLTSVIIPDSVTSIVGSAFNNCSKLTSVVIPNSVTSIGQNAFRGCSSLTSVVIGDSVTSIGKYAFYDCSKLTNVTIGNSVTSIGKGAFENCSSLKSATFKDTDIWYYTSNSDFSDGIGINVTDPAQNATYLRSAYDDKYWYKK